MKESASGREKSILGCRDGCVSEVIIVKENHA